MYYKMYNKFELPDFCFIYVNLGIQVNYAIMVDEIPQGPAILRHLVLCSSGDHMGLCEVGKFIKCGKKGCQHCDTSKCINCLF